jgi:hypothetical protein
MSKTPKKKKNAILAKPIDAPTRSQSDFEDVLRLIDAARGRALSAVNKELIDLYWSIGEHISGKIATEGLGQGDC